MVNAEDVTQFELTIDPEPVSHFRASIILAVLTILVTIGLGVAIALTDNDEEGINPAYGALPATGGSAATPSTGAQTAQPPAVPPLVGNAPAAETSLRMTLTRAPGKTDEISAAKFPRLRLLFENNGDSDIVLNLGTMLGNGKEQRPDAVRLLLTDKTGQTRTLQFAGMRVAGRLDDLLVPLPAGAAYQLGINLADYSSTSAQEVLPALAPGTYQVQAALTGSGAKSLNGDTAGLKHLNFWKGEAQSNRLELVVE